MLNRRLNGTECRQPMKTGFTVIAGHKVVNYIRYMIDFGGEIGIGACKGKAFVHISGR